MRHEWAEMCDMGAAHIPSRILSFYTMELEMPRPFRILGAVLSELPSCFGLFLISRWCWTCSSIGPCYVNLSIGDGKNRRTPHRGPGSM
jgi:hypothetical protein